jgi:hypothetical protein
VLREFGMRRSHSRKGRESLEGNYRGARWGMASGGKWVVHSDLMWFGNVSKRVASSRRAADADEDIPAGREASRYIRSHDLFTCSIISTLIRAWIFTPSSNHGARSPAARYTAPRIFFSVLYHGNVHSTRLTEPFECHFSSTFVQIPTKPTIEKLLSIMSALILL